MNLNLVAISAESPAESNVMKKRKNASFMFIADPSLKLIDAYHFRNKNISQPGFVLLHQGEVVWEQREMKFHRQNTTTIIEHIQEAQMSVILKALKKKETRQ